MTKRYLPVLLCLFVCLTSTPAAFSQLSSPLPASSAELESLQQAEVQEVYDSLLAYTDSATLDIQLSSFATLYPGSFASALWVDLVSMPGGLMLTMYRHEDATGGTVTYSAGWETLAENWLDSPGGQAYGGHSVQQVLDGSASEPYMPDLTNAHSLTAYAVDVTMDGQTRNYSAVFVWYPTADGGLDFVVSDNIVAGVADAAAEELPPPASNAMTAPLGAETGGGTGGGCTASTTTVGPFNHTDEDTNDHYSGKHYAYVTLGATCTCDTSCMGTCAATVTNTRCWDSGVTWWCHKMQSDSSASTSSKHGGGASCAAGFSCSETHTWFCLGTKKIKVKIEGVEVEFEDDGASDWSVTWPMNATCGPCTEATNEETEERGETR